jgi:hypothetical protein
MVLADRIAPTALTIRGIGADRVFPICFRTITRAAATIAGTATIIILAMAAYAIANLVTWRAIRLIGKTGCTIAMRVRIAIRVRNATCGTDRGYLALCARAHQIF